MSDERTHVEVVPRRQLWYVQLVRGDIVTTVGQHTARFRAEDQAARLRERYEIGDES